MNQKFRLGLVLLVLLSGCKSADQKTDTVIKVASHTEPMTTLVNLAKEEVKASGYTIELVSVSDNVQANAILNQKEVDANFFQHQPYMKQYNAANKGTLKAVQPIYDALVGFYSKTYSSMEQLPDHATIAIPNDKANEGRALAILNANGLITLKADAGYQGTIDDIIDNPHGYQFMSVDPLNLVYAYDEADLVFNYPTYMKPIGLTPKQDALLLEKSDGYFAISVVAREDNADSEKIKALVKAMTSDAVKNYITEKLGESVVSMI